jgi:hypothetical protein
VGLLEMTVADNSSTVKAWDSDQDSSNEVAGSFSTTAGITVAAQNIASSSAVQQSVNVQANLTPGGGGGL